MKSGGAALGGVLALGAAVVLLNRGRDSAGVGPKNSAKAAVDSLRKRVSSRQREEIAPGDPNATDDQTALARMLASEDPDPGVRVMIGWTTVERARTRKRSLYEMITKGNGYGGQAREGEPAYYASTRHPPTVQSMRMAGDLLAGRIRPSARIRDMGPGDWVQRGQGIPDSVVVSRQSGWKSGLWAQLRSGSRNTGWVLYSRRMPVLPSPPGGSASGLLDSLPFVEAVDESVKPSELGSLVA